VRQDEWPTIAIASIASVPTIPIAPSHERSAAYRLRRPLPCAEPRHDEHDEQVCGDVEKDVHRGDQHADRLHGREVAGRHVLHETCADAGVAEHVLDQHDAAEQVLDDLRQRLDRRRDRVPQGPTHDHAPLANSVETGHLDVVGLDRAPRRRLAPAGSRSPAPR